MPYIIAAVIGFSATVLFVSFRRNSTNSAKGSQGAADAHMVERYAAEEKKKTVARVSCALLPSTQGTEGTSFPQGE